MDLTLEVRWFYEGDIPDAVADWFQLLEPTLETTREDVYMTPANPVLNVKLREGKVQVKRRELRGDVMRFGPDVAGHPERWYRWSFPVAGDGLDLEEHRAPKNTWQYVTKERYRRVFDASEQMEVLNGRAAEDGHLEAADMETATAEASVAEATATEVALVEAAHTEIELTRVAVGRRRGWTLCVETQGEREALMPLLRPMGRHVFRSDGAPVLEASRSYGYNQWLKNLSG